MQVGRTGLSCNHGDVQVEDQQAPSAEIRGTVISQDATTLKLNVFGFTSGLTIGLGGQTIPTLAAGTRSRRASRSALTRRTRAASC